jgi:hypothetical protein
MSNKKAQGLTLNTIVVAALVLIVLVVLILIFTGQMQQWLESLQGKSTCPAVGVVIRFDQSCNDPNAQPPRRNYDVCMKQYTNVDDGYKCCVPQGTTC